MVSSAYQSVMKHVRQKHLGWLFVEGTDEYDIELKKCPDLLGLHGGMQEIARR